MDNPSNDLDLSDLRFLIVEDQGFQRWTTDYALRQLGATTVFSAADGRTALEIYKSAEPPVDIIITDLHMPGMDGMEFIRHVAEYGAPVALILATDQDQSVITSVETMTRAYGVYLLEGIKKPLTPKKLAVSISRFRRPVARSIGIAPAAKALFSLEEIVEAIDDNQFEPFFQP